MARCPRCDRMLFDDEQSCPDCTRLGYDSEDTQRQELRRLVPIARFKNVAEAGYFASELLARDDIPSTMMADDKFDAMDGFWSTQYLLCVPQALAEFASNSLRDLIAETEPEDHDYVADSNSERSDFESDGTFDMRDDSRRDATYNDGTFDERDVSQEVAVEDSNVNWVPIVLTLAAGSVVLWAARKLHEPMQPAVMAAPAGSQQDVLWSCLTKEPAPWIQRLGNGAGLRELRIDREHELMILREDADGDGRFEREVPIPRESL